jgi:glycosyltransferase A (GT-A) superfamily protein (DUF2064 family)
MFDVFTGIAWSTSQVMAQTRRRLRRFHIAFAELPATYDIDTAADLRRLTAGRGHVRLAVRRRSG